MSHKEPKTIKYDHTPFHIIAHPVDNGDGYWRTCRVEIFENNNLIGEYKRNYSMLNTFYPFRLEDQWYALYSPHYTGTRVMKLPSCEDFCGEDVNSNGFCPMGFYVPQYRKYHGSFQLPNKDTPHTYIGMIFDNEFKDPKEFSEYKSQYEKIEDIKYLDFGFVSGCVWGDDSSAKLEYLDLSKIKEGKLERKALFGYLELAEFPLKDCISLLEDDGIVYNINIATLSRFGYRRDEQGVPSSIDYNK